MLNFFLKKWVLGKFPPHCYLIKPTAIQSPLATSQKNGFRIPAVPASSSSNQAQNTSLSLPTTTLVEEVTTATARNCSSTSTNSRRVLRQTTLHNSPNNLTFTSTPCAPTNTVSVASKRKGKAVATPMLTPHTISNTTSGAASRPTTRSVALNESSSLSTPTKVSDEKKRKPPPVSLTINKSNYHDNNSKKKKKIEP